MWLLLILISGVVFTKTAFDFIDDFSENYDEKRNEIKMYNYEDTYGLIEDYSDFGIIEYEEN